LAIKRDLGHKITTKKRIMQKKVQKYLHMSKKSSTFAAAFENLSTDILFMPLFTGPPKILIFGESGGTSCPSI
jgi:hypothetical protein